MVTANVAIIQVRRKDSIFLLGVLNGRPKRTAEKETRGGRESEKHSKSKYFSKPFTTWSFSGFH